MEGAKAWPGAAEQAIQFLLDRNYLLTALELVQEANEAGLGHEVERLRQLFQDPALFPPEEVAACNPDGAANFVAVANERQQQLSSLQWELAVAKEDLAALRQQAAAAAEASANSAGSAQPDADQRGHAISQQQQQQRLLPASSAQDQLSAAQIAALNRAVLAHLHAQGFKLAALSLSKEAHLPPAVAASAGASDGSLAGWYAAAQRLKAQSARLQELEEQAQQQERQLAALQHDLEESREKEESAAAELEFVRTKLRSLEQQLSAAAAVAAAQEQEQVKQGAQQVEQQQLAAGSGSTNQQAGGAAPAAAQHQGQLLQRPGALALSTAGTAGALVEVAACMPKILPNVLINKRDELIPALSALCQEHPEAAGRRQLAGLLFNLIKKPNMSQRSMIVDACASLAKCIGGPRAMLDLLPHLKEQVKHELVERRLLVADAASALAPLLPPAQAVPTLLRLLEVLLQDSQPQVRCHALGTLARLLETLGTDTSSFGEALQMVLAAAADGSSDVTLCLLQTTLPAMLRWVGESELLVTQLLPQTLVELQGLLDRCPAAVGMAEQAADMQGEVDVAQLRAVPASVQNHAATLLQVYISALPAMRSYALQTQPAWVAQAAALALGIQPICSGPTASLSAETPASASSDSAVADLAQPPPEQQGSMANAVPKPDGLARATTEAVGADHSSSGSSSSSAPQRQHTIGSAAAGAGASDLSHAQGQEQELDPGRSLEGPNSACHAADVLLQQPPVVSDGSGTGGLLLSGTAAADSLQHAGNASLPAHKQRVPADHQAFAGNKQLLEAAAFAAWVQGRYRLEEWRALDYVAVSAVPALMKAALMVAPSHDTALLTQRFVSAMKATCLVFGEAYASVVIAPQLQAAAGIPGWMGEDGRQQQQSAEVWGSDALHLRLASSGLLSAPATPAQLLAGFTCSLPLLLAGVLPYAGSEAVGACLRRLCTDGGSRSGQLWALEHPRAFVAAVRSAADVQLVQAQLVPVMWELVGSKQAGSRIAAALLAGAAAPSFYKQQVTRQLLPLLATLGSDPDVLVCRASIAAASVIFSCLAAEEEVQEALFSNLDDLLIKGGHAAEMALFAVFAPAAAGASSQQLEWLLQRLLLMLAAMHQRGTGSKTPSQLVEAAATAFIALRQIEAHEFTEHRLCMHFAAALAALQRESDLLDQSQRDALAAMIEDHESRAVSVLDTRGSGTSPPTLQSMLSATRTAMQPSSVVPSMAMHAGALSQQAAGDCQSHPGPGSSASFTRLPALFAGGSLHNSSSLPISYFLG